VVVASERLERLVRILLASFAPRGSVPLRVVFDNPKTVVVRREGARIVWNATLAQVVLEYGFSIERCTPRHPEQNGAVENLVGFVKRAFFRACRFVDLIGERPQQLAEWLREVNEARPSRATKEPPVHLLQIEQARLQPLLIAPTEYGLPIPVTVGPTATVHYQGVRYAMPAAARSLPATLHLYPDRAKVVTAGGRHEALHPRVPLVGRVSYLTGQRAQQLAVVYGARKRLCFMRERRLELWPVGEACVTELVHQRAHTWQGDVERLFHALEGLGEATFRAVLQRALMQHLVGPAYVERLAESLRDGRTSAEPPSARTSAPTPVTEVAS